MVVSGEKGEVQPLDMFLSIGLDRRTAENAIINPKVTANLTAVIKEAKVVDGCSKTVGNLLYMVATKYPAHALIHRPVLLEYIISLKIKNPAQLDAALTFLSNVGPEAFQLKHFEETCGVSVEVSIEEIQSAVTAVPEENMDAILKLRYHINVGNLCGQVRKRHPWADAKLVKEMIDEKLRRILGERTAADDKKPLKKKEKLVKVENQTNAVVTSVPPSEEEVNPFNIFPQQPEENSKVHTEIFFSNGAIWRAYNTKDLLERHLKATGGKVLTRFPTEPNGYLHIGHAKAMFIDFGLAKERNGSCYLRFDDTNPEAEKVEYIDHIQEIVQWMGYFFQDLYDLAVELIRRDLAYVDHQFTPHPRAGDKWCIYSSYDYAHCIVHSLENITHSLCSLEFEIRCPSYYWLLVALGLYQPYVWEYSRLNISNTVMSKRKLNRLVTEKWVDGWDDPRLMTLAGLRRRGVSATSINAFIRGIGITRSMIRFDRLEYHIREELNKTTPRTMVVLHPLKVVITNLDSGIIMDLDAKMWPDAPSDDVSSFYKVLTGCFGGIIGKCSFTDDISYALCGDAQHHYEKFNRLWGWEILVQQYLNLTFDCQHTLYGAIQGVLQWVVQPSPGVDPLKVEVRLFENLFISENPAELEDWLADLNPCSKDVVPEAYAVPSLASAVFGDKFQFERLGYFAVDPDTAPGNLVFNRTVTLRDSYSKGGNK